MNKGDIAIAGLFLSVTHFYCYSKGELHGWSRGFDYGKEIAIKYHCPRIKDIEEQTYHNDSSFLNKNVAMKE